jgi:hypothetical protein
MKIIRTAVGLGVVTALLLPTAAYACPRTSIDATFGDACRDVTANASRDISTVWVHYADGRVVKHDAIGERAWALDGGPGDEIAIVFVRSGFTKRRFTCDAGAPPTAVLEIRLTPGCSVPVTSGDETFYWCTDGLPNDQRTVFVDPGDSRVEMSCDFTTDNLPCTTVTFRGSASVDPDGDLSSWSMAFDDGTVVTGQWPATPPDDVTHEYHPRTVGCSDASCQVTLTVTDARGRTDTDRVSLVFVDATPD